MKPRIALAVLTAVSLAALVGCGVGAQQSADRIDANDLTQLPPSASTEPSATALDLPDPSATEPLVAPPGSDLPTDSSTPSSEPPSMRTLTLYFVAGSELTAVDTELPEPTSLRAVLDALESAPTGSRTARTVLLHDLVTSVRRSFEGVTVNVDREVFSEVDTRDQQLLFGQIVLTLTGLPDDFPSIDQVRFTIDGEPLAAPQRDGTFSEPGGWVSATDYERLTGAAQ